MTTKLKLNKPDNRRYADWDFILNKDAGLAYIAEQLGGFVDPEICCQSENLDYQLFADGSLLIYEKNGVSIYPDVSEALSEMPFDGVVWDELDQATRELLNYCFGGKAIEVFKGWGGVE